MLHPDRFNPTSITRKAGVVVHDSESGDGSSDTLLKALASPGDRDNGHGGVYGAGYSAVTDGRGGYTWTGGTQTATAAMAPFHAPPLNEKWYGICIPGFARQTREEWLDELSDAHISGVAKFIVGVSIIDNFPTDRVNVIGLLAGDSGYCAHDDVSKAWGKTDHYDPGPNFPWDILAAKIAELTTPAPPEEDDDMFPITCVRFEGFNDEFIRTSAGFQHGTVEEAPGFRKAYGVPAPAGTDPALVEGGKMALVIRKIRADNAAAFKSALANCGLTESDLSPSKG